MSWQVLSVKNLNKYYGRRHILKNVTFQISEHEIVGFIGPNGAGKSTTMKCICNLVYPDSGSIHICGYELKSEREKALNCQSSLIEAPGLYTEMTGRENIKLVARIRRVSKERINEICDFTRLGRKLDIKVSKYSMGMKQRLGLAIALLSKPRLLILDKPTNGLDPTGVIELRNTLQDLVKNEGVSILFSSHQLGEIEKLADRIICINNGEIIANSILEHQKPEYLIKVTDVQKSITVLEQAPLSSDFEIDSHDTIKIIKTSKNVLYYIDFIHLCNNLHSSI